MESRFGPGLIGPAHRNYREELGRAADSYPPGSTPAGHMLENELAQRWRTSVRTLQRWRRDGSGPPYLRIGQRVLYQHRDVEAYEARHREAGDAP